MGILRNNSNGAIIAAPGNDVCDNVAEFRKIIPLAAWKEGGKIPEA